MQDWYKQASNITIRRRVATSRKQNSESSKLSLKNPGTCQFGQKKANAGGGYAG